MNDVAAPFNTLPSIVAPQPDSFDTVSRPMPTEIGHALEHCIRLGRYGTSLGEPTCGRAGLRVRLERPSLRSELELVRLADGVFLASGRHRVQEPVGAWCRHRGAFVFTVLLRGGMHWEDRLGERFTLPGGSAVMAEFAHDATTYSQCFARVTTEFVSVIFQNARAIRDFGIAPEQIRRLLGAPGRETGDSTRAAVCAPEREVLAAAQAIRDASYEGAARQLYLKGKTCEMLAHLMAGRIVARSAAESVALASSSQFGIAALAHAALGASERQPTAREIARRIGVTEGQVLRAFKATYGTSLHEHATAVRMARARQLLLQSRLPLIEVALACGYEHHSSFSTAYQRNFGETPVQTRRSALEPA